MKKLWAKILKNHKIVEECVVNVSDEFDAQNLYEPLKEICYELKIETPIILSKHKNQLEEFGITKFLKTDFIDSVNFDSLVIEYFELS